MIIDNSNPFCSYLAPIEACIYPRGFLCELPSVWNPFRREATKKLVQDLHDTFPFLLKNEDAEAFIKRFNFGMTLQHIRNSFNGPSHKPTRWLKDNHFFPGREKFYGLHEDLKPFFHRLRVCLLPKKGKTAEKEEVDSESDKIQADFDV